MTTTKKRLNITLSPELEVAVKSLARRDKVSQSDKVAELLITALEIEEDHLCEKLAHQRDVRDSRFVPHRETWV